MRPVSVFSLTAAGAALAERVAARYPAAERHHRPGAFADTVRARFAAGHGLVLITATGIAMRTLAPALGGKATDPPVLVLDDAGRFVVPLLSGHEGGANAWGRELAGHLGARLVVTTARPYTRPVWAAGLGCDRGCPAAVLAELLDGALAAAGIGRGQLAGLASIDRKAHEPGLVALGEALGTGLTTYPAEQLRTHEAALTAPSAAVFAEVGCYGVAEAAALAHAGAVAGTAAELVVPKHKGPRATVALARAYPERAHD